MSYTAKPRDSKVQAPLKHHDDGNSNKATLQWLIILNRRSEIALSNITKIQSTLYSIKHHFSASNVKKIMIQNMIYHASKERLRQHTDSTQLMQ